jgi:cytochrome c oxidase subunit 1
MGAAEMSDHVRIGRGYFFLSLIAALCGVLLSLLMRVHLVWPQSRIFGEIKPEDYLAYMTVHGTLMVFFVLSVAPQNVFGNLVLPEMLGAKEMALPTLNRLSLWFTAVALMVTLASLFARGGAPGSGWTQYPPLSVFSAAQPGGGLGMDLWLFGIGVFCVATLLASINFTVTILKVRAPEMPLMRMPLPAWGWLIAALISLLAFSVLLAAVLLLFCDRHMGTSFFVPTQALVNQQLLQRKGGSPLIWQHLFWFFGHPEVYLAILPGMAVTSHMISNFSRRRVYGYRAMVTSLLAIGILGFMVWGHHMFTSGMSPFATIAFSALTVVIAVPSSLKVVNWLGTLWGGCIRLSTPMLFALGFVSLFVTGGLSGPILAQPLLDTYFHDTYFVVAHFHLIMGMAGMFGVFAATYFWFPQLSGGRLMNETLGRAHFWLSLIGAYCTFLPMHFLGMAGHPRRYSQLVGSAAYLQHLLPLQKFITLSALALMSAQLLFLVNVLVSWRHGKASDANPWQSPSLEWSQDGASSYDPYDYSRFASSTNASK